MLAAGPFLGKNHKHISGDLRYTFALITAFFICGQGPYERVLQMRNFHKTATDAGWLHKSHLIERFNIGYRTLENWVTEGYVRSVKIDQSKQGRRIYSVSDITNTLEALACGQEPKRRAGRVG